MAQEVYFSQRKGALLGKKDKSSKGDWDKRIVKLCEKINKKKQYYTTSSCSGRVVVMIDDEKKGPGLFKSVFHDGFTYDYFMKCLPKEQENLDLKFKQEPCILHIGCDKLEDAKKMLKFGLRAGWKKSGIISSGKRFIVELNATDKLEFPLTRKGKLLVGDDFLKLVVKESNEKLKKSWDKIKKLEKLIK